MKILTLRRLTGGAVAVALIALLAAWCCRLTTAVHPEDSPRGAVVAVVTEQQAAWNRGDIDAFMKGYWDSAELTFAGSAGVTRGWQPVLDRYRKNYPDQKAMGKLEFSELEVRPLGKDAALVIGRWHLKRDADELGGVFTLVFERFPEGWRIIHDHTSLDAKKPQ